MASDVRCGRTTPAKGPAARAALRDRFETLVSRAPRVRSLLPLDDEARDRRRGLLTFELVACPLPAVHLRDKTRPYQADRGHSYTFGGRHVVERWDAPTFPRLWEAFLEDRPNSLGMTFLAGNVGPVGSLLAHFQLGTDQPGGGVIQFWVGPEEDPGVILPVVEHLGLTEYASPESLEPRRPPDPQLSINVQIDRPPRAPDLPRRLAEGAARLVKEGGGTFEQLDLSFSDSESRYPRTRERLNAVTHDWDAMVFARYRKGFDPFTSPPDPPPGEEYRYHVGSYQKGNVSIGEHIFLKVDVVHADGASFLEFYTQRGLKTLLRHADLADVTLELWDGPMSRRWGEKADDADPEPE